MIQGVGQQSTTDGTLSRVLSSGSARGAVCVDHQVVSSQVQNCSISASATAWGDVLVATQDAASDGRAEHVTHNPACNGERRLGSAESRNARALRAGDARELQLPRGLANAQAAIGHGFVVEAVLVDEAVLVQLELARAFKYGSALVHLDAAQPAVDSPTHHDGAVDGLPDALDLELRIAEEDADALPEPAPGHLVVVKPLQAGAQLGRGLDVDDEPHILAVNLPGWLVLGVEDERQVGAQRADGVAHLRVVLARAAAFPVLARAFLAVAAWFRRAPLLLPSRSPAVRLGRTAAAPCLPRAASRRVSCSRPVRLLALAAALLRLPPTRSVLLLRLDAREQCCRRVPAAATACARHRHTHALHAHLGPFRGVGGRQRQRRRAARPRG